MTSSLRKAEPGSRIAGEAGLKALRSNSHGREKEEEDDDPELQAAIRASKKEYEASKRS